eukprot:SAG31_NODE_1354_length_8661_cov_170.990306_7_plen_663_part_00
MAPAASAMAIAAQLLLVAAAAGAAKPLQHLDPTLDVETRLAALLPTLSVEQLMTQTLHVWTRVHMDMINKTYSKTGVGAAYSNHPTGNNSCDADPACNLKARLALNRELMKTCGIPVTFVAESLHSPWITQGVIMPMPVALGSSWNSSLLTEVGAAIAAEATACASTRGFSPEINVCTDPRFGRTQENFGADAQHVAAMGVAITIGLQGGTGNASTPRRYIPTRSLSCEAKVTSIGSPRDNCRQRAALLHPAARYTYCRLALTSFCALVPAPCALPLLQHLAAYGSGDMDGAPAEMSEMTLRDIYLKPWKKFFAAGGRGAMLSHNSINGIPAHMHKKIMTDIVRGEWNHSEVFFASDAGDIDHISSFHIGGDPALLSITAGMDQALTGTAFTTLADSVKSGRLDRKILERAAASTLREKIAGRLFDKKYDGVSDGEWGNLKMCRAAADGGVLDAPEHRATARQAAQESTVMLVNGKAGAAGSHGPGFLLPLTAAKWEGIGQIAIVGPNANISKTVLGSYVSAWGEYPVGTANAEIHAATVLSSARAAVPASTKIVSAALDSDNLIDETELGANQTRLIADAVEAANTSDVVVAVLGDSTKVSRISPADPTVICCSHGYASLELMATAGYGRDSQLVCAGYDRPVVKARTESRWTYLVFRCSC